MVAERDGLGELLRALDLVELLFDGLAELRVVNVFEDENGLDDRGLTLSGHGKARAVWSKS